MNELQKLARVVHSDFVAGCIYKMEASAKAGKFSIELDGSPDELRALVFYCAENGLKIELGQRIAQATAKVSWTY